MKKFGAEDLRKAKVRTITAKAVLVDGTRMEVPLTVLRGDAALTARKEFFSALKEIKELLDAGGKDMSEETLTKISEINSAHYRGLVKQVVTMDDKETLTDEDWEDFAVDTGGRDTEFGRQVYRAAGLKHPQDVEETKEERSLLDDLPFLSRGKRR